MRQLQISGPKINKGAPGNSKISSLYLKLESNYFNQTLFADVSTEMIGDFFKEFVRG